MQQEITSYFRFTGKTQQLPSVALLYYKEEDTDDVLEYKNPEASFDVCTGPPMLPGWRSWELTVPSPTPGWENYTYQKRVYFEDWEQATIDGEDGSYTYTGPGTPFELKVNDTYVLPCPSNIGQYASVSDAQSGTVQDNVWQPEDPKEDPGDRFIPGDESRLTREPVIVAWAICTADDESIVRSTVTDPSYARFYDGGVIFFDRIVVRRFSPFKEGYQKILELNGFPYGNYTFSFGRLTGWDGDWAVTNTSYVDYDGDLLTGAGYNWDVNNTHTFEEVWGKNGLVEAGEYLFSSHYEWDADWSIFAELGEDDIETTWDEEKWSVWLKTNKCAEYSGNWENLLEAGYYTRKYIASLRIPHYGSNEPTYGDGRRDPFSVWRRDGGTANFDLLVFEGRTEDILVVEAALQAFVDARMDRSSAYNDRRTLVFIGRSTQYGCKMGGVASDPNPPEGPPELLERFFDPTYRGRYAQVYAQIQMGGRKYEAPIPTARFFHRVTNFETSEGTWETMMPALNDPFKGHIDLVSDREAIIRIFHSPIREWHAPGKRPWMGTIGWGGSMFSDDIVFLENGQVTRNATACGSCLDDNFLCNQVLWTLLPPAFDGSIYCVFGDCGGLYSEGAVTNPDYDVERVNPKLDRFSKMLYMKATVSGDTLSFSDIQTFTYPNIPADSLPNNQVANYIITDHEMIGVPARTNTYIHPEQTTFSNSNEVKPEYCIIQPSQNGGRLLGGIPFYFQNTSWSFEAVVPGDFPSDYITPREDWTDGENIVGALLGYPERVVSFLDRTGNNRLEWQCHRLTLGKSQYENRLFQQPGFLRYEVRFAHEFTSTGLDLSTRGWGSLSWLSEYADISFPGLDYRYFYHAVAHEFVRGNWRMIDGKLYWMRINEVSLPFLLIEGNRNA